MRWLAMLACAGVLAHAQGDGVIRLKPREFRQLPPAVRRDLERRGCTIPQFPGKTAPHNVISGSFIASGSRDWAVLCSVNAVSRILVYRNGAAGRVDSLARQSDAGFLQSNAEGVMEFSRKLDIAESRTVAEAAQASGGPKPQPLDHSGIGDGFIDKAAITWYYSRGKWLKLSGADSL
jgi:hypothetical protein